MIIQLNQVGKRFNKEWIFRNIQLELTSASSYAILGPNGSGKSTLLKVLSGYLSPSEGKIEFVDQSIAITPDQVYSHVSYCAPYIELIEELTVAEQIEFHRKFKPFIDGITTNEMLDLMGFERHANKQVKNLSSGMRQRLKLGLAVLPDSSVVLLDEPTTNLDQKGVAWYQDLLQKYGNGKLIVVASNLEREYTFCTQKVDITEFKAGEY